LTQPAILHPLPLSVPAVPPDFRHPGSAKPGGLSQVTTVETVLLDLTEINRLPLFGLDVGALLLVGT
jgi:hypothetical protein